MPRSFDTLNRTGFTLVELLAVIGIIGILVAILIPAVNGARRSARNASATATIKSVGDNLEMYINDHKRYPDSARRPDPITLNWPDNPSTGGARPSPAVLNGAHWLARAMFGHDFLGLDTSRSVEKGSAGVDYETLKTAPRDKPYMEGADNWAIDDVEGGKLQAAGSPGTGRAVMTDPFGFPILYYRANPKAGLPFGDGIATTGIYNLSDNEDITGSDQAPKAGWNFKPLTGRTTPPIHSLGHFGLTPNDPTAWPDDADAPPPAGYKGNTFANYIHDEQIHQSTATPTSAVLRPQKRETFILISAGEDGEYGTKDDLNNFEFGQ